MNRIDGIICKFRLAFSFPKLACSLLWAGLGLGLVESSFADLDANTRLSAPAAISAEIGGRMGYWSITFDQTLSEVLSAGIGLGGISITKNSKHLLGVPLYGMYYFMKDAGSLFVTGGVAVFFNSGGVPDQSLTVGSLKVSSSPFLGNVGAGYEYRSDPGYLLRITGYLMLGSNIAPWIGITLGYSF